MTTLAQPNPESRFDRDGWIVAAAAGTYIVIALIIMLIGLRLPADGWQYDDLSDERGPLALNNISRAASPLQPGDTAEGNLSDSIAVVIRLALAFFLFVRRPRNLGARALLLACVMMLSANIFDVANSVAIGFSPSAYGYGFFSLGGWGWGIMPALITFVLVWLPLPGDEA